MSGERFELFVVLMSNVQKSIQRIKMQKMKRYSLSSAHTNCICRLEIAGERGLTQMELVRQEMMDASQISRVLRELIQKGYVQVDGESGKYRRRYSLTDTGMVVAEEIRDTIREINHYVSGEIPMDDLKTFYRTLNRISDSLNRAERVFLTEENE